jgi:hypothetical protein
MPREVQAFRHPPYPFEAPDFALPSSIGPAAVRVFWGLLVKDAAWAAQAVARLLRKLQALIKRGETL